MLTRREKLLVRPWQQRRYNNHRRKVQSALPAIDVGPPPHREHVCCKLKKLQSEIERSARIEQDNFRLLQRMGSIMRTNRLDNRWLAEPPNFLHRVGIYYQPQSGKHEMIDSGEVPVENTGRRNRCSACYPRKRQQQIIPEERIPWEPVKLPVTRAKDIGFGNLSKVKSNVPSRRSADKVIKESSSSVMLTRGTLHLSVNFPPHTTVKLKHHERDKLLLQDYCECKAVQHRQKS